MVLGEGYEGSLRETLEGVLGGIASRAGDEGGRGRSTGGSKNGVLPDDLEGPKLQVRDQGRSKTNRY